MDYVHSPASIISCNLKFKQGLVFGIEKVFRLYHAETWLFIIIFINSSHLKDPYSNMVAGQATPSGVFDNDDEDRDQDFTVKKCCKTVVAIPDRLDV